MEDSRLYSGYDEYAGIFGPLQASSSSAFQSRGRLPPRRRGFSDSRNLEMSSKLRKGRKSTTREFDRRAKFLAKRKAKAVLQPLEGDSDGAEDLQDKENEPASPTHGLQRQVWLPTRNFAFRQRAGKLDTRVIARLDLEKIAATTDIETIQRHLENLAFADVTLDDVQHYSDAYFLKLFQIAQVFGLSLACPEVVPILYFLHWLMLCGCACSLRWSILCMCKTLLLTIRRGLRSSASN